MSDFTSQARCCSVLSEISSRQLVEHPGGFGQFVEIKQPANGLASDVTNGDQLKWIIAPFSIFPEFKWMKVCYLCVFWGCTLGELKIFFRNSYVNLFIQNCEINIRKITNALSHSDIRRQHFQ